MTFGYSSHGVKTILRNIKKLEVNDRNNDWFRDDWLDLDKSLSIWVCYSRKKAAEYVMSAGDADARDPTEKELDALIEVDLTGSIVLLQDGDGGFLHVWPASLRKLYR